MSAIRIASRDGKVVLVDLGPASAQGHVHDGGRLARPELRIDPEPLEPHHSERLRAQWAAASRRYRARTRA